MNEPTTTTNEPRDSNNEQRTTNNDPDDEISLLDLLIVLAKHKKLVLGLPFAVAVLAVGYSLTLPNIYTSKTTIIPPQQSQSGVSTMLAQLGGVAGLVGDAAGIKSPNDLYIGLLRSRTVADNLIQQFDLMNLYQAKYRSQVRQGLAGVTHITAGKDGIIAIEVDDKDPKRAADLANAYVAELLKLTRVLAVTEASQRRLFLEQQMERARDNLANAEAAARQALEKGGLIQVEGQGRAIMEAAANLRGQITAKEVQIGAMRAFAADRNPTLQLAQKELEVLKRELEKTEGTLSRRSDDPREKIGRSINNLGLLRDVKYYETIYELLVKQFEIAKIDEAKAPAVVQVVDKAIEPDYKSKPKRSVIVVLSAFVAFCIGIVLAFVREGIVKARANSKQASRLLDLKRHLAWK